jgi:hypothetical protein
MTCTGSFGLSLQLPDSPSSVYAEEGNRLHDIAEAMISDDSGAREYAHADMEAVMSYVLWCRDLIKVATLHGVEQHVSHSALLGGTPDFWALVEGTLNVVDLKTGGGIPVSPVENFQLMVYAWMLAKSLDLDVATVRITIVQPPVSDEPQHWHIGIDDLMLFGEDVEAAIAEAIGGSTELVPGEHCRWCKAKPTCPKLLGTVTEALRRPVAALQPALLGEWLNKADLLNQWTDALRERAHQLTQAGQEIPGWKLKPKRATRTWDDEEKVAVDARARRLRIFQPRKLMSPAMAEKAHPNLPPEITSHIVAISTGTNLVRDDNPSPRIETTKPTLGLALKNLIYRT